MTGLIFGILFSLIFLLFPCAGQISLPPDGNRLYGLPGRNVTIAWRLISDVADVQFRTWTFLSHYNKSFAHISGDGNVIPNLQYSPGPFTIKKPATLILENVTIQYDGIYRFISLASGQSYSSDVTVIIEVKANVTINCNNPLIVNEGDALTCLCVAKGGKPPADVTWEKDGVPEPDGSGKENKTLNRINVSGADSGTYMCVAKGHTLTNNKSIEVKVRLNAEPNITSFTVTPDPAAKKVTITCISKGVPSPNNTIIRNGTEVSAKKTTTKVSTEKTSTTSTTYIIDSVTRDDTGIYTCIAKNKIGNDAATVNLTVQGQITPTPTIPGPSTTQATSSPTSSTTVGPTPTPTTPPPVPVGLIIGIIVGVLVLIIIVVVVVYCYKSKQKERGNRANIDPVPGNHYELENEEPVPDDGAYDTVGPVGASSSKSKPPAENTLPPVYAAVDKNNRQGNTLYASLDNEALLSSRASKKEPDRPPQTEYARIDFAKSANAPKADLV